MRAVRVRELGSFERTGIEETPDPRPGDGEVLVEIHAAPVNYVDLITFAGEYQFSPQLPYTPGKGPAGVVRAVGAAVTDLSPGDRVLAMAESGGYAELVAVDRRSVHRLPAELSFVAAASLALSFDTSWMALRERARLQPGETVLVLGATGAVGGAAVQLARAMGSGTVLAAVSSPERFPSVAHLGADAMVDLSQPDLRTSIRDQVRAATGGAGVDVVIDPLGGDPFDGALRSLAWRGRLVVVGFATGRIPTLKVNYALLKNVEVSGLQISDYRTRTPDLMRRCFEEIFGFAVAGTVTPPPSAALPLARWRAAMEAVRDRRAVERQILLPRE